MAITASLTTVIVAWAASIARCDKDFSSPTTLGIGGIFPSSDTTSQYAFQYAVSEYAALFDSAFNITLDAVIETTGDLSTPGMGALDAVSRLLNDQHIAGIVGFDSSLDIVVASDTLAQATTP